MNSRALVRNETTVPEHEAIRIVMAVTGRSRTATVAGFELTVDEVRSAEEMMARRRAGEPLQYLEEVVPFGPIEVAVDRRALIPRPETEYMFELARDAISMPSVIVDIGTGTGCLAIALKQTFPSARVIGTDLSPPALALAGENANRNSVDVEFHVGDLYGALPRDIAGSVDLLVSNPPYVTDDEITQLPPDVANWEPSLALAGGADGLSLVRPLVGGLRSWLAPEGVAFIEVGERHAVQAAEMAASLVERAVIIKDLADRDRFLKITLDGGSSEPAR